MKEVKKLIENTTPSKKQYFVLKALITIGSPAKLEATEINVIKNVSIALR